MNWFCYALFFFVLPNLLCSQGRIFLSHPYGTLGNKKNLTASISVSDLDRDGDLDVLVGNGRHWAEQNYIFITLAMVSFVEPLGWVMN